MGPGLMSSRPHSNEAPAPQKSASHSPLNPLLEDANTVSPNTVCLCQLELGHGIHSLTQVCVCGQLNDHFHP